MAILNRGLAGEPVKRLQAKLGLDADGQFGPKTEEALKAYQKENGLVVDGIAGPDTFAHMGLHELILLRNGTSDEAVKKAATHTRYRNRRSVRSRHREGSEGLPGEEWLARGWYGRRELSQVPASMVEGPARVEAPAKAETAPRRSIWDTVKSFFG